MQTTGMVEMESKIDRLWSEVLKMREESGACSDSPQKQEAIRLMHQWASKSEEGMKYFQRKRLEIRLRLVEMDYREGKYISARLQLDKAFHLYQYILGGDLDYLAKLRKLNNVLVGA